MNTKIFWEENFNQWFDSGEINVDRFNKYSQWLYITRRTTEEVDLAPLKYLKNLKELGLLNEKLINKQFIAELESLKKITFNSESLNQDDLQFLVPCSKLKSIHLCNMNLDDVEILNSLPNLTELRLHRINNITAEKISKIVKLKQLELSETIIPDLDNFSKMKNLKELTFSDIKLTDLSFLKNLSLKKFQYEDKVENEDGLKYLSQMSGLKELNYPLSNFELFADSKKIESVIIDASKETNLLHLAKFPIKSASIFHADSEEKAKRIEQEVTTMHPKCHFRISVSWE